MHKNSTFMKPKLQKHNFNKAKRIGIKHFETTGGKKN